ncbi:hypothetical protein L6164_003340 [Bauhinia variegata]|uniref:Uncharacterized protein n=1 Tax=Bauhinia variegata TaxID=167791 RepID=A0ACB9Q3P3_BAUVA|nr:hypothetical protein L6164_003340 [Bauhinia variegata]
MSSGCNCGSSCGCSDCKCGKNRDVISEQTTTATLVMGVAPTKAHFEGVEMGVEAAENGCKCGSNCTCDPCNCK